MTSELFTAGVPVEAIHAEPMTISEIDAHPDRARIWATVKSVCRIAEETEADLVEMYSCEDTPDDFRESGKEEAYKEIKRLISGHEEAMPDRPSDVLDHLKKDIAEFLS